MSWVRTLLVAQLVERTGVYRVVMGSIPIRDNDNFSFLVVLCTRAPCVSASAPPWMVNQPVRISTELRALFDQMENLSQGDQNNPTSDL